MSAPSASSSRSFTTWDWIGPPPWAAVLDLPRVEQPVVQAQQLAGVEHVHQLVFVAGAHPLTLARLALPDPLMHLLGLKALDQDGLGTREVLQRLQPPLRIDEAADVALRHVDDVLQRLLLVAAQLLGQLCLALGQVRLHLRVGQQFRGAHIGGVARCLVAGALVGACSVEVDEEFVGEEPLLRQQPGLRICLAH